MDAGTWRREGDIGYIRLPGFNEQTAAGLEKAVRELKKQIGRQLKGYVLDLRNNPGGLLDQAIQVSDDFLDSGEIVSTRGRHPEDTQRYDAKRGDITDGKPIVVLINGGTASASRDRLGRAAGPQARHPHGHDQLRQRLGADHHPAGAGRGALRLTTARYYTPSGHSIQAQGIIPDIVVEQAKVELIAEPQFRSEAELPGALQNIGGTAPADSSAPATGGSSSTTSPAPNADESNSEAPQPSKDYQLARAIDLIHGLALYAESKAN